MSKIDSRIALDELLLSQKKRDATALKSKQDIYKDDVSNIVEALGIPSAKLNQFVKAYNGDLESVLGEMSSTVDVLEILNEGIN